MTPLISIITINYNNAAGLERTIRSVVSQSYPDMEYLVIDGNSTDGSKEVINRYADKISYSISEKDSGIYNAMNKGISKATGRYLLFVNSGDELIHPHGISTAAPHLNGEGLVYFNLILQTENGQETKRYPNTLSFDYFLHESLPHPASFIKRELFTLYGPYNESYKIVSDWAFFLLIVCKYNASYKHVNETFSVFFLDGISSSEQSRKLIEAEKKQIVEQEFPLFVSMLDELKEGKEVKRIFESSRLIRLFRSFGFLRK